MSLDMLEATAVSALNTLAQQRGVNLDAAQLVELARTWLTTGVALLDGDALTALARAAGS